MRARWLLLLLLAACGTSHGAQSFANEGDASVADGGSTKTGDQDATLGGGGGPDTGLGGTPDVGAVTADGAPAGCTASATDLSGCNCPTAGATRSCYPDNVDPSTRGVGACQAGTQTCSANGEFGVWTTCTGVVVPTTENCAGMTDNNCNGKVGCADPSCASSPTCNTGCTDGQTRPCYDGPSGTENVGTCADGMQTCTGGQWPTTCTGEVLPQPENCCDAFDHNCNGLPGCFDIFSCFAAQCCSLSCTSSSNVSPGCVCPTGAGDEGTCPLGDHLTSIPNTLQQQCCPCTANDCGDINCCPYDVCSATSQCQNQGCQPTSSLPASCNGQVSTDCDDWPEDCDEPCCLCAECPEGAATPGAGQ